MNYNQNPLTELQSEVLNVLFKAKKKSPVAGSKIISIVEGFGTGNLTGMKLRQVINVLRDKGLPICAGKYGYYYPESVEELREYILGFQHRIQEQNNACNALLRKLNEWQGKELAEQKAKQPQQKVEPIINDKQQSIF